MLIRSVEDIDRYLGLIRDAAARAQAWLASHQTADPLNLLRRIKFEPVGVHPIEGHALNLAEQIDQTWTYVAALAAARELLKMHPEAEGYRLEPGSDAAAELDIMSEAQGVVGAETFAAVDPRNNRKLAKDLEKMAGRRERHRYVFFMSPKFPGVRRLSQFERNGVQVWSVDAYEQAHNEGNREDGGRAVTDDRTDPHGIVLATLRDCRLQDQYTSEQDELQPDLADALRKALGDGFEVEISVGPGHPKPRVPLFGTTFWPDLIVSRDGPPITVVEAKYIRKGESSTSPIAETIGQSLIYSLQYPRAVAFILQEGTADVDSEPEARLRGVLARCGVDLVLRRR